MIDTHCHLLPGLDDGPPDLAVAVRLARQLQKAGVTAAMCTPHFSARYPTTVSIAEARLADLSSALETAQVPLGLLLAAELSPARLATSSGDELASRSIGGYVLVELLPDTPGVFIETALQHLQHHALRPIFAHPERCHAIRTQPRLLDEARAEGALVQVVASSLTRRFGARTEAAAWRLLELGCIDLLASDAHRPRREGTHLEHAARAIEARLGADAVEQLTTRAPLQIVGASAQAA